MKLVWLPLLIVLLVSAVFSPAVYLNCEVKGAPSNNEFFFGVTFGGNTTSEAKLLIDNVKGYTNLFVIDSFDIGINETALNEICDYATNANMYVIVFFSYISNPNANLTRFVNDPNSSQLLNDPRYSLWQVSWLETAKERWGNKFLSVYLYDEPGGKQIDKGYYTGNTTTLTGGNVTTFRDVANYSDAANRFVRSIARSGSMQLLTNSSYPHSINSPMPLFTSDYALYWFDYLAGYNTVFAELGGSNETTKIQQISLCRGAANVQNKQWGAIITWSSMSPPYLENGTEMLQDMLTAYRAGAKYIVVFNYPTYPDTNPYGILSQDQFNAMEDFWNQAHSEQKSTFGTANGKVALVLPEDYGWGMRTPDDKIWGFWTPDDLSPLIWDNMHKLIKNYGLNLDIIYDDPQFNFTEKYSKIYFWNSTIDPSIWSVPSIPPPYELYAALAIAAVPITCVPSYLIMRHRKRRSTEAIFAGSAAKASLKNPGSGTLEFIDNIIKFYIEKGYFNKRKEISREVPLTDIESVKRVGNEFSITWKGVTDIFVIEKAELVGTICERITGALKEQRKMLEDKEAAKQKRNELARVLSVAMEIVDSLFDVLRSLQGRVDWNRVKGYLKRFEENVRSFAGQKIGTINLDFAKLSLAVKEHRPEEISKETCSILRSLYEYFSGLTSRNESLEQIHPNYHDAKATILAYYTLNDIILGTIVGDEEIGKESNELVMMLYDLSKGIDLEINVDAIKDIINKLGVEKGKESVIEESRAVFIQQLKELITKECVTIEPFTI